MPEAVTDSGALMGPLTWRVAAGEVDDQAVAGLLDVHADPERRVVALRVVGNAVAVAEVLETALAVRQIGQGRAHQPLGIVHDLGHVADEPLGAVALRQSLQPLGRAQGGGELGAEVALALVGRAHVGQDHLLEVDIERAAADEPQRRQAQPLAVDLRDRAVAAGRGRADIGPVRAQAGVAEQAPVVEGRAHHVDIGEVAAAEVGVVVDEHVAVVHVGAEGGDHGAHRIGHGAQMDRQIGPLRHHRSLGVEHAAGVVAGRFQDRRVGGLGEDDAHLLGDLGEAVLDDLEGGGIGLGRRVSSPHVGEG